MRRSQRPAVLQHSWDCQLYKGTLIAAGAACMPLVPCGLPGAGARGQRGQGAGVRQTGSGRISPAPLDTLHMQGPQPVQVCRHPQANETSAQG